MQTATLSETSPGMHAGDALIDKACQRVPSPEDSTRCPCRPCQPLLESDLVSASLCTSLIAASHIASRGLRMRQSLLPLAPAAEHIMAPIQTGSDKLQSTPAASMAALASALAELT